jgi:hypothetical protein
VLAQQTVWFLSRFEKARSWLLDEAELVSFAHLGAHAFANLSGEKANVVAFVQKKRSSDNAETTFVDLRAFGDAEAKYSAFVDRREQVTRSEPTAAFDILPGRVLAHWLPQRLRRHFQTGRRLADFADVPGSQNKTGRNRRYVKKWSDISPDKLRSAPAIAGDVGSREGKWVFYSKGGRFSPWWGNWQNVVDWSDEARRFYAENRTSNLLDEQWWFREGICYTDFGGRTFNARLMPAGCVFDMAGPAVFAHDDSPDTLYALLAVLNSTPVRALLNAMNPSLHYQVRDLRNLPVPEWSDALEAELVQPALCLHRQPRYERRARISGSTSAARAPARWPGLRVIRVPGAGGIRRGASGARLCRTGERGRCWRLTRCNAINERNAVIELSSIPRGGFDESSDTDPFHKTA